VPSTFGYRLEISERKLLLRFGDTLLIVASLLGALLGWASLARRAFDLQLLQSQLYWVLPILVGWLLWLALSDTYNLRLAVRFSATAWRIVAGALVVVVIYLLVFFVTSRAAVTELLPRALTELSPAGPPPLRFAPVSAIVASAFLLLGWRLVYVLVLCGPQTRPRMLILGAGLAGRALYTTIAHSYTASYNVVGFIDDDPRKQSQMIGWVPVLGTHYDLEKLAWEYRVDEIVLAISRGLPPDLMQLLIACHERGLTVTPMPLVYERLTGKVAVDHIGSQWYVALPLQKGAADTALRALKRAQDLIGGLLLGLLLALLMPFIALAIKLDSAGPVFYRQERLGRHGRVFIVYKLRSMRDDAERDGEPQWATLNDTRVTRVGRFLRRTRLDELPQILNVIRGEMSLVGPRPERPEFVESLQNLIPFYRTRLAAKPGLTGWAQINYGYGSSLADALAKLQYDLYYLKHQSPWFDLLILARTVAVVLRMQGR
jgi:exopolysaccharide biosynthesis polyprenyl glycosylphosphotransferase